MDRSNFEQDVLAQIQRLFHNPQLLRDVYKQVFHSDFVNPALQFAGAAGPSLPLLESPQEVRVVVAVAQQIVRRTSSNDYTKMVLFVSAVVILLVGFYNMVTQEDRSSPVAVIGRTVVNEAVENFGKQAIRGNWSQLPGALVSSVSDGLVEGTGKAAMGPAWLPAPPPSIMDKVRKKAAINAAKSELQPQHLLDVINRNTL
jgi:hypothetical protein